MTTKVSISLLFVFVVFGQQQQIVVVPLINDTAITVLGVSGNSTEVGACTIETKNGVTYVARYSAQGSQILAQNGDVSLTGNKFEGPTSNTTVGDYNTLGCVGSKTAVFGYDPIGKPTMYILENTTLRIVLNGLMPLPTESGGSWLFVSPYRILTDSGRWLLGSYAIPNLSARFMDEFIHEFDPVLTRFQYLMSKTDMVKFGWKNFALGCLSKTAYWTGGITNNGEIILSRDKSGQKSILSLGNGSLISSPEANGSLGLSCNQDGVVAAFQLFGSLDVRVLTLGEKSSLSEAKILNLGASFGSVMFKDFNHQLLSNGKIVFVSAGHLAELDPQTKSVTILQTPVQAKGSVEQVRATGNIILYGVRAGGMIPKMEWNILLRPVLGTPSVSAERQVTLPCSQCGFSDVVRPKVTVAGRLMASSYLNDVVTFTLPEDLSGSYGEVEIGSQKFPFTLIITQEPAPMITQPVVNGASYEPGGFAPQSVGTVFGKDLGNYGVAGAEATFVLGGTRVEVCGQPARMFFNSGKTIRPEILRYLPSQLWDEWQINFLIPSFVGPAGCDVQVVTTSASGRRLVSKPVKLAVVMQKWEPFQLLLVNRDQTPAGFFPILTSPEMELVGNTNVGAVFSPVAPGEIFTIWPTGGGLSIPFVPDGGFAVDGTNLVFPPRVTIGGKEAQVLFSGVAPGFVGLYQVNAQVPADLESGLHILQFADRAYQISVSAKVKVKQSMANVLREVFQSLSLGQIPTVTLDFEQKQEEAP